jgi:hypothetical protein
MKRAASRRPKPSWRPPARFVITVLDAERLAKVPTFPHRRPPSRTAPQCSTARHYSQVGVRFWECTSGRPILGVSRQRDPAYGSHAVDSQNSKQHRDSPNTERVTANCPPAHDHNRHPDQSKHSGDERRSVTAALDDEPSFQPHFGDKIQARPPGLDRPAVHHPRTGGGPGRAFHRVAHQDRLRRNGARGKRLPRTLNASERFHHPAQSSRLPTASERLTGGLSGAQGCR